MLTILRVIDQNLSSQQVKSNPNQIAAAIKRDDFKIIYVCVSLLSLSVQIIYELSTAHR